MTQVHHIYQRARSRGLIFYCEEDYLVFFTILCTLARKQGLEVVSLRPRPDRIHQVLEAADAAQLSRFVQRYAHLYAREWNASRRTQGPFFQHSDGRAAPGRARPGNGLPKAAPPALDEAHARSCFRAVLQEVRACFRSGNYIRFAQLERWGQRLTPTEKRQLAHYIIGLWNVVETEQEAGGATDAIYEECTRVLLEEGCIRHVFEIPGLPEDRKKACYRLLRERTSARPRQIRKYLHLSPTS